MSKRGNGEGSIYQRKSDGKWVGSVTLGNGKRRVYYGKTRKEVQEKLKVALHEQQQGALVPASRQTVQTYLDYWLEAHKVTIRLSTYVKYQKLIKYIVPILGDVPLQKLTPLQVQSFYAQKLQDGLAPKTVNSIHGLLHEALDQAVKWNMIPKNVCDLVSAPRISKKELQVLTREQARTLLKAVKEHRLETILLLAVTTGMRRGELLALRWQDVNLETGTLQIQRTVDYIPKHGYVETEPKTKAGRRKIVLPSYVVEALKAHRLRQDAEKVVCGDLWVEKDLVFCGLHGNYFNPGYLWRSFSKFLRDIGLPHMRFHDLRHSAATILLEMNVHPKIVQELLGHSTIDMTMNMYSHVLPSLQKEVAERWDETFSQDS